jgi:Fe-S-cluster containining protein
VSGPRPRDALASLDDLAAFHAEVDREVAPLAALHRKRLQCRRGCADCCVDDLTVFAVEAERIRRAHGPLLAEGSPASRGRCAFLDREGGCRVYDVRPYVCRTQGLPLRWVEDDGTEYRDICPLNDHDGAITELPERACWTLGPAEGRLAELQRRFGDGRWERVRLRDLFGTAGN